MSCWQKVFLLCWGIEWFPHWYDLIFFKIVHNKGYVCMSSWVYRGVLYVGFLRGQIDETSADVGHIKGIVHWFWIKTIFVQFFYERPITKKQLTRNNCNNWSKKMIQPSPDKRCPTLWSLFSKLFLAENYRIILVYA